MKGKKRFNIVDCVILLCVILIIVAVVFRAQIIDYIARGENLSEYTVVFESDPIGNSYASYITAGKQIEWVETNSVIGEIKNIESVTPADVYTVRSDGTLMVTPSDSESVVRGTLTVRASDKDGCFISGTDFVGAGMKMTLRSNNALFTVTVISVTGK